MAVVGKATFQAALLAALVAWSAAWAGAESRPISADRFRLSESAAGARFLFASSDPGFPFPPVGPPADGPTGLRIEVFAASQVGGIFVSPGEGWSESGGLAPRYSYFNRRAPEGPSPLRRAKIRQGKHLRVRGFLPGFEVGSPLGPVVVRIEIGSETSCAFFAASTIQRDSGGVFRAVEADAAGLADCATSTIVSVLGTFCGDPGDSSCGGTCPGDGVCTFDIFAGSCRCVFSSDPCGGTEPVCNGTCPEGEECVAVATGLPVNGCTCTPVGVTPCGASGFPSCGGVCPEGNACEPVTSVNGSYCGCFPPGPCGGFGGTCPSPLVCTQFPGSLPFCLPIICGTLPSCGGGCPEDWSCHRLRISGVSFETCACSPPGAACGGGEGFECPEGLACTVPLAGGSGSCLP